MEIDKKIIVKLIQTLEDLKKSLKGIDIENKNDVIEEELFGKENKDGIPERIGLVEQAHNGTLYIDEVTNLCRKSQRRLIKLITENRFNYLNKKLFR